MSEVIMTGDYADLKRDKVLKVLEEGIDSYRVKYRGKSMMIPKDSARPYVGERIRTRKEEQTFGDILREDWGDIPY